MKIVASDGEFIDQETTFIIDMDGAGFALFARRNGSIGIVDDANTFSRFNPDLVGVGVDFPFDRDPDVENSVLEEFMDALGTFTIRDQRKESNPER